MRALLVGYGEIGRALYEVLSPYHDITVYDPQYTQREPEGSFDVLLVAIPYSDEFTDVVNGYRKRYGIETTIIFSTVAIGTTRKIPGAVHSPVEGKHPLLATSLKIMPRWVGGAKPVAVDFLRRAQFDLKVREKPETTELLKLQSTSLYGVNIEFARQTKEVCDANGVDFADVQDFNRDYNELYRNLRFPQFQRYILDPPEGNIGGHCIVPNAEILDAQYPSVFLKEIYRDKEGAE